VQNDQSFLGMTANVESYRIAPNNMSSQSGPNVFNTLNCFMDTPKKKKKKKLKNNNKDKDDISNFYFYFYFL
jgi:hypothetical protein